MKENNKATSSGGIGFIGALQIAFIVLKLLEKINWRWLWVLAPTWISISLVVVIIAIIIIIAVLKDIRSES